MATLSNFKIDGQAVNGVREIKETSVSITFDNDSVQANINFDNLSFVNKANEALNTWANGPFGTIEGTPFEMDVQDGNNVAVTLEGYIDHSTRVFKSPVESEASIVKTNGLNGFFISAQGITMLILQDQGIMPKSDGVNIPYITENRDSRLAKLQMVATTVMTFKAGVDEVFKLIALVGQLPTGGGAIALVNIGITIANLVLIINQLSDQLSELQQVLFPLVTYHRGIKLLTFLEKGCQKLGYTLDIGSGTFATELAKVNLCPHKSKEDQNQPVAFMSAQALSSFQVNESGILRPNDFGYVLSDAFELAHKLFLTKVAVIGGVVKLLPFNDPFWTTNPAYTMPDVLIEDSPLVSNGEQTTNQNEELNGRTLIEYTVDDSDMWTNEEAATGSSAIIAETIVEPINVSNNRNVILKGLDSVKIPYALGIRKQENDPLLDAFLELINLNGEQIQNIKDKFETYSDVLNQTFPTISEFVNNITSRAGAMKIEHHYFSVPKIVYLEDNKIPINFEDKIGAKALYDNYHSYKSFVPGIKNPNDPDDTNQKLLFEDVRIPFGINDFNLIINNSYFNASGGNIGKFTSVLWNTDKDEAIVSYYIFQNYLENIKEKTI